MLIQNQKYASVFRNLLELCHNRSVAVQTIKSLARRPWGNKKRTRTTWYEPFEDQTDIDRAVHWVLNREGIFLNTSADIHLLPKILDAANRFERGLNDEEMKAEVAHLGMEPLFDGRTLLM